MQVNSSLITIKNVKEYITSYRDTPMKSQDTMNLFRLEKSPNLTSLGSLKKKKRCKSSLEPNHTINDLSVRSLD